MPAPAPLPPQKKSPHAHSTSTHSTLYYWFGLQHPQNRNSLLGLPLKALAIIRVVRNGLYSHSVNNHQSISWKREESPSGTHYVVVFVIDINCTRIIMGKTFLQFQTHSYRLPSWILTLQCKLLI